MATYRIIDLGAAADFTGGDIMPDGQHILGQTASSLVADDTNAAPDAYIFDLTSGAWTRVSTTSSQVQFPTGAVVDPGSQIFSADGRLVLFRSQGMFGLPYPGAYLKDLATGDMTQIAAPAPGYAIWEAVISPDGKTVAYSSDWSSATSYALNIYTEDVATGAVTCVSTDSLGQPGADLAAQHPVFSPDGTKLLFQTSRPLNHEDGFSRLYLKDLVSGAVNSITDLLGRAGEQASFSPDGSRVAFVTDHVYILNLISGELSQITSDVVTPENHWSDQPTSPHFSPDGRFLEFASVTPDRVAGDPDFTADVFLVDLSTGYLVRASPGQLGGEASLGASFDSFSPDGTSMTISVDTASGTKLVLVDLGGVTGEPPPPQMEVVAEPTRADLKSAIDLGTLDGSRVLPPDTIGDADTVDLFRFHLDTEADLVFSSAIAGASSVARTVTDRLTAGDYVLRVTPGVQFQAVEAYTITASATPVQGAIEKAVQDFLGDGSFKSLLTYLDVNHLVAKYKDLLAVGDGVAMMDELFTTLSHTLGVVGHALNVLDRLDIVRHAPDPAREGFIQFGDLVAELGFMGVIADVTTIKFGPIAGVVAGAGGGLLYTTELSDGPNGVKHYLQGVYDTQITSPTESPSGNPPDAAPDLIVFDPTFYLANHPDAAAAVANGTAASALSHFLAIGAPLGYLPSAGAAPVNPADLLTQLPGNDPAAGPHTDAMYLPFGAYAGDGADGAELALLGAINSQRLTPLTASAGLFALANRLATDHVADRPVSPQVLALTGQLFPTTEFSNGKTAAELFPAMDLSGVSVFEAAGDNLSPAEALQQLLLRPEVNLALLGEDSHAVGLAEYGGLWVLLVDSNPASDGAPAGEADFQIIRYGSEGDDYLVAGARGGRLEGLGGSDVLIGGDRADILNGGDGADTLKGGAGDDLLDGGAGSDLIDGGAGRDTASFADAAGSVQVKLAKGSASSGADHDTLVAIENITGSGHADSITGSNGVNALDGGGGDDRITGGKGADRLTGGDGDDRFVFQSLHDSTPARPDLITDLQAGDLIDLSGIDADSTLGGDQAFTLVSAFTGQPGELCIVYDAKHDRSLIEADVNGDKVADLAIAASGDQHAFTHFVL